tara:strand:- start:3489 stop:4196 length:708 start_codon:yes stop_codon:yes gene_type:complete
MNDMEKKGAGGFGEEFLGPDYQYTDYIKDPDELGMSESGNFSALANNVSGTINYVNLLISGRGAARRGSEPLGARFFIKTGGKCKPAIKKKDKDGYPIYEEIKQGEEVDRFFYVDNVPKGKFFGSKNLGIIPGMMENVEKMNPLDIISAFTQNPVPFCKKISRKTTNKGAQHLHVAYSDLPEGFKNMLTELQNMKNRKLNFNVDNNVLKKYPMMNYMTTGFSVLLFFAIVAILKK